ncbi:MAG: hypothetical protein JNN15_18540 [Blastocatellia bacterium]|nr:hypothetical protein [Blastocatellia bacterium]
MVLRKTVITSLLLPLLVVMITVASRPVAQLGSKESKEILSKLPGMPYDPKLIKIKRIEPGSGGAVVSVQFDTAFRFSQKNGKWQVAEMRFADDRWEDMELILTAVKNEKIRRTESRLQKLAAAINSYKQEHGYYPRARDIVELTDLLSPRYMNEVIREDLWFSYIQFTSDGKMFTLRSNGPDLKSNSGDEVTVESK